MSNNNRTEKILKKSNMGELLPEFGFDTDEEFDMIFLQCLQQFDFKAYPDLFPFVQALAFN